LGQRLILRSRIGLGLRLRIGIEIGIKIKDGDWNIEDRVEIKDRDQNRGSRSLLSIPISILDLDPYSDRDLSHPPSRFPSFILIPTLI
jgi:hypothetical protein